MESTTVKLYSLNYGNVRTYLAASLFKGGKTKRVNMWSV